MLATGNLNFLGKKKEKKRKIIRSRVVPLNEMTYCPEVDEIFILPVANDTEKFLRKVWGSFTNKMVSMTYSNDQPVFDHAVFEYVQAPNLKIVTSSSHFMMKEYANGVIPKELNGFIQKTKPIRMYHEKNLSARMIRSSMKKIRKGDTPDVEFVNLKEDKRLHPKVRTLMTPTMNYATGIPLFVNDHPIGVIWGIYRKAAAEDKKKEMELQLKSLFQAISEIVENQLNRGKDDYAARRAIEKIDTRSIREKIFYTRYGKQLKPVKSIISKSYINGKYYRLDASYTVPTTNGYSISFKRFFPQERNNTRTIVVMLPGFFCNRSLMDRLAREMTIHYGYPVFSLDMRGRSELTLPNGRIREGWTMDDYIQEDFPTALQWLRQNYPEDKIIVMGHSMGGFIPMFYTGSFDKIRAKANYNNLPNPQDVIGGIVAITSPSYIDLEMDIPGMDLIRSLGSFASTNTLTSTLIKFTSRITPNPLVTINLNMFFTFLHKISQSIRNFSFNVGTNWPTLRDFVGYRQITPPEWYFLMEDVFCEESVKVIIQFFKSQFSNKHLVSYDGEIDYTEDLKNVQTPLLSVVGAVDKIAPPDTVVYGYEKVKGPKEKMVFEQGHLGITIHPPTVRAICKKTDSWIRAMK